jgi:hypothetical protein
MGVIQSYTQPSCRHYKHEHRLDGDENKATPLVHTRRADQWASCKATHNPTPVSSAAASGYGGSERNARGGSRVVAAHVDVCEQQSL